MGLVCALMGLTALVPVVVSSVPDTGSLLRDTTAVARVPAWFGATSRLVNLFWASAATLLLGLLTVVLTLDDTLLVHDDLLPRHGVPEGLVLTVYAVVGLVLATRWWPHRASAVGLAFFVGGGLLASSVLVDALSDHLYLLEDTLKFLGLVGWGLCGVWALSDELAARTRRVPPKDRSGEAPVGEGLRRPVSPP